LGLSGCIKPFANHPARLADGTNSHTRAAGFDPNDIAGLPFGFFWHGLLPEISVIASPDSQVAVRLSQENADPANITSLMILRPATWT